MAKVTSTFLTDFHEAFSNILVYQGSNNGLLIVRKKVVHPSDLSSAHLPSRTQGWAKAVDYYERNIYPDKSLTDLVADFALSPDSPKDFSLTALTENPPGSDKWDITFSWHDVTHKFNGWPCNNLSGYHINFSTDSIFWQRLTVSPQPEIQFTDNRNRGVYYYTIQAIDDENHFSHESTILEVHVLPSVYFYGDQLYGFGYYS